MTTNVTARQKQVLDFVHGCMEDRGYAPSLREIARHLRISGTRAVEKHIQALERKGHLTKGSGARALGATSRPVGRTVPIIGRVAAGAPILAEENIERTITLDTGLARWKNVFGLTVSGDSMKNAGIFDGDVVLVRSQNTADNGEIVVAIREGEATVKRLSRRDGKILLLPENPAFEPIPAGEGSGYELVGKVVGVLRIF